MVLRLNPLMTEEEKGDLEALINEGVSSSPVPILMRRARIESSRSNSPVSPGPRVSRVNPEDFSVSPERALTSRAESIA